MYPRERHDLVERLFAVMLAELEAISEQTDDIIDTINLMIDEIELLRERIKVEEYCTKIMARKYEEQQKQIDNLTRLNQELRTSIKEIWIKQCERNLEFVNALELLKKDLKCITKGIENLRL